MANCKILGAQFETAAPGLTWIEIEDRDDASDLTYPVRLLVETATDRMVASIDGPTKRQISYCVAFGTGESRKYISLDGAKQYAITRAIAILEHEDRDELRRHERH